MSRPPRLPPIACLQAFEALARLRSVNAAGDELSVTPSAVSHRSRQLETQLGRQLFQRDFSLTVDGQTCLAMVRQGLDALAQLPGTGGSAASGVRLRVAVTPTFSRQVLLPRLALFRHAYPDIELVLQVAIPLTDTKSEDADLEIRYGLGPYAGVEQRRLMSDEVSPVCSPEYLHEAGPFEGLASVQDVQRARLIRTPLEPWSTWFQALALDLPEPQVGSQFNDVGLVLDAAAAGFGVALMRLRLGQSWLASGQLVRLSARSVASPFHHHLCWRPGALARWECAAFADWLQDSLGN